MVSSVSSHWDTGEYCNILFFCYWSFLWTETFTGNKQKSPRGKQTSREHSNVHCFSWFLFGKGTLILAAIAYFEFRPMGEEIPWLFIAPGWQLPWWVRTRLSGASVGTRASGVWQPHGLPGPARSRTSVGITVFPATGCHRTSVRYSLFRSSIHSYYIHSEPTLHFNLLCILIFCHLWNQDVL